MKRLLIFLLLILVFLAGCTTSGGGGSGVIIRSTSILPDGSVEPGIPISLNTIVQNSGIGTARNVRLEIVGLTDEWLISPGRTQNIGDMFAADPSRNSPGSETSVDWTLTAPGKSNDITYSGYVRLTYSYETTLDAQIQAVSSNEYKQSGQKGGIVSQSVTSGPISISVTAPNAIISGGTGRIPIQFSIQNIGSGKVRSDRLTLTITGATCSRTDVTLIEGTSASLSCSINTAGVNDLKNFPISVKTSYEYRIESPISITVLKTPKF